MSLGNLSVSFVKFYNKLLSCWQGHLWNFGKSIYGISARSFLQGHLWYFMHLFYIFLGKSFVSVNNVHVLTYCFTLLLTVVKKKKI